MTKYSRTAKFEDLRNQLQNSTETETRSRDIQNLEKRLNRIDSANFAAPDREVSDSSQHDPIHSRRRQSLDQNQAGSRSEDLLFNTQRFKDDSDNMQTEENDYLDQYIREVKQYNIDQGNAYSTNTNLNILKSIHGEKPEPVKPYPNQKQESTRKFQSQPAAKDTAEIPVMRSNKLWDQEDTEDFNAPAGSPLQNAMKQDTADIATEVQNLVNHSDQTVSDTAINNTIGLHLEADRTARQQLLNETTQMRAQLDDYEDNLTEVSDKMKHTNRILNFVLIVLILALAVVLMVVIYWIMLSKGVIGG